MVNKLIGTVIKVAGVIITAPVTWLVAGQLFADIRPEWLRVLVQIAALSVVEGVFITNWIALDNERNAPPEIKGRYALTAGGMYLGLWVLALWHGEGVAGLVFRLALGGALVGSMYDAGIHTMLKRDRDADRDIMRDWRVARHARRLAREDAIADLNTDQQTNTLEREARATIEAARIALEKQQGLAVVKAEGRANVEAARGRFPFPVGEARARRDAKHAKSKARALEVLVRAVGAEPGITHDELGDLIGKSRQTVSLYLGELADNGRLIKTPDGGYQVAIETTSNEGNREQFLKGNGNGNY